VTKAVPRVVLDTNVVLPIAEQEELLADWLPWVEVVQIPDTPPPVPHCRDLLTLAGTPGLCPALGIAEFCHRYLAATLSNQCPPNAQHFSIASQLSYRWRAMPPRRRTSTAASPRARWAVIAGSGAATGRAEVVPGGYRVSGRWRFVSGAQYATTSTANCLVTLASEAAHASVSPLR
jgi:hypothetical protein